MAEAGKAENNHVAGAVQVAPHAQPLLGLALRRAFAQGRKRQGGATQGTAVSAAP